LFIAPTEPALPLDPETIRVVIPGASNDLAGLNAMQPMTKATDSDRHYLLPLPPGLQADSPEMFGFFTYELRVGHYRNKDTQEMTWCTAQGRFGRPLRATGIQHPAPALTATVNRDADMLYVSAPYAAAVFNGKNVTANPPRTALWCLLYAQVKQADNKDFRNILLDEKQLDWRVQVEFDKSADWLAQYTDAQRQILKTITIKNWKDDINYAKFQHIYKLVDYTQVNKDATRYGTTAWSNDEISQLLQLYGLPPDLPLSILVVEMLPTITNIYEQFSELGNQQTLNTLRSKLQMTDLPGAGIVKEQVAQINRTLVNEQGPDPLNEE
jgi:hypothetical protein